MKFLVVWLRDGRLRDLSLCNYLFSRAYKSRAKNEFIDWSYLSMGLDSFLSFPVVLLCRELKRDK